MHDAIKDSKQMKPTSASNRQTTLLRKLNRKKYRQQEQLFLLEGARAVDQVLQNMSIAVETLFFDEDQEYWQQEQWSTHTNLTDAYILPEDIFAEVTDTDNPQGVLALCHIPGEATIEELSSSTGAIVVLDAVQDPGNLGTIIRTASWFGAKGILSGKGTVDLFHPKVVRGTAGATGSIPHCNGELVELLPTFEEAGWSVFIMDVGADAVNISEISSTEKTLVVVGNEAHGVDSELITENRQKVRIPSPQNKSVVESLNVAVATAIVLYDFGNKMK
jgi:TrmH family RNA methyltransferase